MKQEIITTYNIFHAPFPDFPISTDIKNLCNFYIEHLRYLMFIDKLAKCLYVELFNSIRNIILGTDYIQIPMFPMNIGNNYSSH